MAKYGNNIGDETAPAWYTRWERERREEELAKVGLINWEQVLAAASEYMDAEQYYRGNEDFKGHYIGDELSGVKRKTYDAERNASWAERVLYTVCYATGIPEVAIIRAARIEARYYDKGGTKVLDAERLIRSQL